jgi:hypothetical protein
VWAVSKKLRVSAMVQLAFLFEKQWDGVQLKFVFWVLYSSQTLLQHFGTLLRRHEVVEDSF